MIEDGSKSRYIVNLKVSTTQKLQNCVKSMGNNEIVSFNAVKKYFISGVIWENEVNELIDLPSKGEEVIATFDYLDDELVCKSINLIPRRTLKTFDLKAIDLTRRLYKKLIDNGRN